MTNYIVDSISEKRVQKARKDGKPSLEYVVITFRPTKGLEIKPVTRVYTQYYDRTGTPTWGTAKTAEGFIAQATGETLQGQRITKTVVEYQITDPNTKVVNTTNKHSMVVFEGEDIEQMFRKAGHPLLESAPAAQSVSALVTEEIPA